jgi:hypothetical protein
MKARIFCFIIGCFFASSVMMSQNQTARPQRTPEEEAAKQTERLIRELNIKDSARIDTLYKMHLKYAIQRQKGLTRAENIQRMQAIYAELKVLLTTEELERFMNHPAEQPRRPHGAHFVSPENEAARKQQRQEEHLQ